MAKQKRKQTADIVGDLLGGMSEIPATEPERAITVDAPEEPPSEAVDPVSRDFEKQSTVESADSNEIGAALPPVFAEQKEESPGETDTPPADIPEHEEVVSLHFVSFKIDGQGYALPLESVESVLRMVAITPLHEAPAWVAGVINLQGKVIPVIDLRQRLGRQSREYHIGDRLLVVGDQVHKMAIMVDEATEVMEVPVHLVQKPDTLHRAKPFASVIQREEDLILVLDIVRMLMPEGDDADFGMRLETIPAQADKGSEIIQPNPDKPEPD